MMILATGKNSGFTLVEIMISIAILSMGLILILQGFTNSLNILRIAEHNLETSLLAEEKMVEMEINVKQDKPIPDKYLSGESQSDNIGFQWQIAIAADKEYEDLNKVLTTVSWQEGRRKGGSVFSTYLIIPHGQK